MSWRELPWETAIDLDTLPVGGKVRATTSSKTVPILELEKLSHAVDVDAMGPVTIVDATGKELEKPLLHARSRWLRRDLANFYFSINGNSDTVLRYLGAGLHFCIPGEGPFDSSRIVAIKTVEIWSDVL